jgi:hypothetical protein
VGVIFVSTLVRPVIGKSVRDATPGARCYRNVIS